MQRRVDCGRDFVARAKRIGIETVLMPVRAPQANGGAERWVGALRRECLDHIIPLGDRHLRRVLAEYVAYDNATRPHQALGQEPPAGPRRQRRPIGPGQIVAVPILGGLHHAYHWAAACRPGDADGVLRRYNIRILKQVCRSRDRHP